MAKRPFMRKYVHPAVDEREAGINVSWASILAGVATFIAMSILFSLIGAAIGLGIPDLTASNPLEGVGIGLVIWVIVALILSFGAAGYVSGLTASRSGFIHGFLTWAVGVIAMFVLMTSALSSAFGTVGTLLGYAGDAVGSVASTTGDAVSSLSQSAFDAVSENVQVDTDNMDVQQEVIDALQNSDIPELQPDYLQSQVDQTTDEIANAGKRVVVDGEDPNAVFDELTTSIQNRIESITSELDEEELRQVISENTDLTPAEADSAIQNVKEGYAQSVEQADQALTQAEQKLNELQAQAEQTIEEARVKAEEAADASARYSLFIFLGLVAAAVLTAFAGYAGAKTFQHQDDEAK